MAAAQAARKHAETAFDAASDRFAAVEQALEGGGALTLYPTCE